jgi:hypothetical protein
MLDMRTRAVAESIFDRNKRGEAEINEALKQEEALRNSLDLDYRSRSEV